MKYNLEIHHRRSIRLKEYDYSQNRACLFGDIEHGEIILNEYGEIVKFTWFDLINHNVNVSLDYFVVMPNHVHGVVIIKNNEGL